MKNLAYIVWCTIILLIFFVSLYIIDDASLLFVTMLSLSAILIPFVIPSSVYEGVFNNNESVFKVDIISYVACLGTIAVFSNHINLSGFVILFINLAIICYIQVQINKINNVDLCKHVYPLYIFILPIALFSSFLIQNFLENMF